jgi:hypothetical protein
MSAVTYAGALALVVPLLLQPIVNPPASSEHERGQACTPRKLEQPPARPETRPGAAPSQPYAAESIPYFPPQIGFDGWKLQIGTQACEEPPLTPTEAPRSP